MYWGCQCSSARCKRLLPDKPTLLGIFSAEIIAQLPVSSFQLPDPLLRQQEREAGSGTLEAIYVLLKSNSGRVCEPYDVSAPFSPTAFGRWKIQFCQAVRRPKIFVSMVSGPANRRFASMPVSASGENAALPSMASRTSSSQSSSSGAKETS